MLLMDEFAIARPRLPVFKQKPEEERLHWGVLPVATRMLTLSAPMQNSPPSAD
jgi:hypothetical protein